jgi:hypothetical protein
MTPLRVLQVFSAANYCGTAGNGAAVILMAENAAREIVVTFKTIPAAPAPAAVDGSGSEGHKSGGKS